MPALFIWGAKIIRELGISFPYLTLPYLTLPYLTLPYRPRSTVVETLNRPDARLFPWPNEGVRTR
jgi:hypothetical protein